LPGGIQQRDATTAQWSAWSQSFTVSDPTTIGAGETLELASAFSGQVSFAGPNGILKLLDPASFAGTVAGMTGQDTVDLANINPTKVQVPNYSGTASSGTLTVTDGSRSANIALLGNYLASSFVTSPRGYRTATAMAGSPQITDITWQPTCAADVTVGRYGAATLAPSKGRLIR
jgi:hypothetical protein